MILKNRLTFLFVLLLPVALKAQPVYKTPSGSKYHLATCRTVKNVSEQISTSKATQLGLQPCKICNPKNIYLSSNPVGKARGEGSSEQCMGFTKAGNRCRHMTRIGNGYCFQHQPN